MLIHDRDGDPRWSAVIDAIVNLARDGYTDKALTAFAVVLERAQDMRPEHRAAAKAGADHLARVVDARVAV